MKIILSRKGFDSSNGGGASPILPDGTLLSLPIPDARAPIRYGDLAQEGRALGPLVESLTHGRITRDMSAHLDPDLNAALYPRAPGWQPIFGQAGAAQSHLAGQGVGPGDLFLFFGWFRRAEQANGRYRYVPGAPDLHVIYGWLQIGQILRVGQDAAPPWAAYHPHLHGIAGTHNTIYIAAATLDLDGAPEDLPGAGVFARYDDALCLTACDTPRRSVWRLPGWCYPRSGAIPFTYHPNRDHWRRQADRVLLQSACRGQEFVLDTAQYPEAVAWAGALIRRSDPLSS